MRALIQRVLKAEVIVDAEIVSNINIGLLILLGIEADDTDLDLEWLAGKIAKLRIFNDENGLMNKDIMDIGGDIIIVSQFTLFASSKKGNRPSFIRAARPEIAQPLYEKFVEKMQVLCGKKIGTGIFGADMKVSLINDGPVTIWIDTSEKE